MATSLPPSFPATTDDGVAENNITKVAAALQKKREVVRVACNPCRTRKVACDSRRPVCTQCTQRRIKCTFRSQKNEESPYMALKRENESLKGNRGIGPDELFDLFQSLPTEARAETMKRLKSAQAQDRSGAQSPSVDRVRILPSLSEQDTARSILPSTQSQTEFELMVRHPAAYPLLLPDFTVIANWHSSLSPNFSLVRNKPDPFSASHAHPSIVLGSSAPDATYERGAIPTLRGLELVGSHRIGPQQVPSYCDNRLNRLNISQWSEIPISNDFAARVISVFLETDHPIQGLFDADLFIEDLLTPSGRFCSSFLVSSLLFCACQAYSSINSSASMMSQAFFDEAEKLRQSERGTDSLPSLSAIQLMSIGCIYQGKDDRAAELLKEGSRMGRRMNLFGQNKHEAALEEFRAMPDDLLRASAHTAWGVYNWNTLHSLHYQEPGLIVPPMLPIPGDRNLDPKDELAIRIASRALPWYMGQTFTMACKFWTIFQQMLSVYYAADQPPVVERIDITFAGGLYQKLLDWADQLPTSTTCGDHSPHHVVILHILYHAAILDVFRPFVDRQQPRQIRSASLANQTANAIFVASVKQLQKLIYIYSTRHRSATYTILWHTALLYVANALLQDPSDPNWYFHFCLCIHGYRDLVASFPVAEGILRGLLTIAMRKRVIATSYARGILKQAHEKGKHHRIDRDLRSIFMVDLNLALSSREQAQVEKVARDFEEMAIISAPLRQQRK